MRTVQKCEWVQVQYWTCAKPAHRHMTREVAERCIAGSERPKKITNVWSLESRRALLERRRSSGVTVSALASEYVVSRNRIYELLRQAEREELRAQREGQQWTDGLSTRAANALLQRGFARKEQVRAALVSGALVPGNNLGKVSIDEVARWLEGDEAMQ